MCGRELSGFIYVEKGHFVEIKILSVVFYFQWMMVTLFSSSIFFALI